MSKNIVIKKKIEPFNKIISVSGDKSISIRCVLLASQAIGETKINNLLESEDVLNSNEEYKPNTTDINPPIIENITIF